MIGWTAGDISGLQVLTDNDHLYSSHVNELRAAFPTTVTVDTSGSGQYTDIQTAITAVLTAGGGCVYIREGTYLISSAISLGSNLAIVGTGRSTIIKLANGANDHVFNHVTSILNNLYFANFAIDGNSANNTVTDGCGIRGIFTRSVFENLYIHDTRAQAIALLGVPTDTLFKGIAIDFTNPTSSCEGIFLHGSGHAIVNCSIKNTGDSGIILETGCSNISIIGNTLTDCANYGIVSAEVSPAWNKNIVISGNSISGSAEGIILGQNDGCSISGNSIKNCSQGILLSVNKNVSITGNVCTGNSDAGINIQGSTNTVIGNNICSSNTGAGIVIKSTGATVSKDFTITGNICEENGTDGIQITLTSTQGVVTGNLCKNNDNASGGSSGIALYSDITDVVITGNRCYDNQTPKTQDYGIISTGSCDYNLVVGNNCRGNAAGSISLVGANNVNTNNIT